MAVDQTWFDLSQAPMLEGFVHHFSLSRAGFQIQLEVDCQKRESTLQFATRSNLKIPFMGERNFSSASKYALQDASLRMIEYCETDESQQRTIRWQQENDRLSLSCDKLQNKEFCLPPCLPSQAWHSVHTLYLTLAQMNCSSGHPIWVPLLLSERLFVLRFSPLTSAKHLGATAFKLDEQIVAQAKDRSEILQHLRGRCDGFCFEVHLDSVAQMPDAFLARVPFLGSAELRRSPSGTL